MSLKLNSYLSFAGSCKEAFALYEKVFKTKLAYSCTYGEQEGMADGMSEADKSKIMHCYLPINEYVALMGADVVEGFCGAPAVIAGNNMAINISPSSEDEAKSIFAELSEGGTVLMPLEKTFWNALYAMFVDKFGISWMINYNYEEECK